MRPLVCLICKQRVYVEVAILNAPTLVYTLAAGHCCGHTYILHATDAKPAPAKPTAPVE